MERRTPLSLGLGSTAHADQDGSAGVPGAYYSQPVPVADPTALLYTSGLRDVDPIWAQATAVYQYGPDPAQRLWVVVPPRPNGRLDLIVHPGGLVHGDPTAVGDVAAFDVGQGTTVVSVGYRKLDTSAWPVPVDDIAEGIDAGFQVAQSLTGERIVDITETGESAGGTALALINYSPDYPTTTVRPDRIITISAPLEANGAPAKKRHGFRYTDALVWGQTTPKADIPITLMGTHGDPVATENNRVSMIREFSGYLRAHRVPVAVYYDPHVRGVHGSIGMDFEQYPDNTAALSRAQDFGG